MADLQQSCQTQKRLRAKSEIRVYRNMKYHIPRRSSFINFSEQKGTQAYKISIASNSAACQDNNTFTLQNPSGATSAACLTGVVSNEALRKLTHLFRTRAKSLHYNKVTNN